MTRSELRRLTSRRLIRVGVLLFFIAIVVTGAIVFLHSTKPDTEQVARAEAASARAVEACSKQGDFPPGTLQNGETVQELCARDLGPQQFLPSSTFRATDLKEILQGIGTLFIASALVVGASAIAADWHAGTMTTVLTWEPRRVRLFFTRAVVTSVIVFVLCLLLQAAFAGLLLGVASVRGTTIGVDSVWMRSLAGVALRVSAVSLPTAMIGYAIASVARNTAAALGVVFVWVAVVESLIRAWHPAWIPWNISDNVVQFFAGHRIVGLHHDVAASGLLLAAYAAAGLVLAAVAFRARDVS